MDYIIIIYNSFNFKNKNDNNAHNHLLINCQLSINKKYLYNKYYNRNI
jgi:hypothetical protein